MDTQWSTPSQQWQCVIHRQQLFSTFVTGDRGGQVSKAGPQQWRSSYRLYCILCLYISSPGPHSRRPSPSRETAANKEAYLENVTASRRHWSLRLWWTSASVMDCRHCGLISKCQCGSNVCGFFSFDFDYFLLWMCVWWSVNGFGNWKVVWYLRYWVVPYDAFEANIIMLMNIQQHIIHTYI